VNDLQRCYTVYTPEGHSGDEALPVVVHLHAQLADEISVHVSKYFRDADRFGFYFVYASTPHAEWQWVTSIANDKRPMPCDSSESGGGDDYIYFDNIFSHLPTALPKYDKSQVFVVGHSQNGMGSGYLGTCFPHKVTGVYRGLAGVYVRGGSSGPKPKVTEASIKLTGEGIQSGQCDGCLYWPTYSCFQGVGMRPLRDCAMTDASDHAVSAFNATANQPMALYHMGLNEGLDVRALVFDAGRKHHEPPYPFDWIVGCLGMRDEAGQCSSECEDALKTCVAGGKSYGDCMGACEHYDTKDNNDAPTQCDTKMDDALSRVCETGCTPTFTMLNTIDTPSLYTTNENGFGPQAPDACKKEKPSASICTADASKASPC
jgi:hypothetical protein